MSPEIWIPLAANAATAIFVYGRLTEKVKSQGERINTVEERQTAADERLGRHSERIMRVETKIEDKLNGRAAIGGL